MGFFTGLSNIASGNFLLDPDKSSNARILDPLDLTGEQAAAAGSKANAAQQKAIKEAIKIIQEQGGANTALFESAQDRIGGASGLFSPFINAGQTGLAGLTQGSTTRGFGQRLDDIIGGGAFGGLVDERQRALQGQLAAGGLTRSGAALEESAAIPTDLALQIENILTGRSQNLAELGLEGSRGEAGLQGISAVLTQAQAQSGTDIAQDIASLIGTGGAASASNIVGTQRGQTQNLQGIGQIIASFFSDPSLKENIVKLGEVGPLDLVRWDWKPEFKGTIVEDSPNVGFLSTQVRDFYPEYVGEFGGFDVIDYHGLVERLS